MYNFHYNFMIRKSNTTLLLTDTDSLCYELYEKNPYKRRYKYKELFDVSNFSRSSKYYCSGSKEVVRKMKDEYGGKSILKFVGLQSKMYWILDESNNEKSTNKGHNAFIESQEFYNTLFQKKILRHAMRGIKPNFHDVLMINDIFSKNGINTLAYGHKDI